MLLEKLAITLRDLFQGGWKGAGRKKEHIEKILLMLQAVLAEVDMQNYGATPPGSGSYHQTLLPCLIT